MLRKTLEPGINSLPLSSEAHPSIRCTAVISSDAWL